MITGERERDLHRRASRGETEEIHLRLVSCFTLFITAEISKYIWQARVTIQTCGLCKIRLAFWGLKLEEVRVEFSTLEERNRKYT
jgi:hypothetical protein